MHQGLGLWLQVRGLASDPPPKVHHYGSAKSGGLAVPKRRCSGLGGLFMVALCDDGVWSVGDVVSPG